MKVPQKKRKNVKKGKWKIRGVWTRMRLKLTNRIGQKRLKNHRLLRMKKVRENLQHFSGGCSTVTPCVYVFLPRGLQGGAKVTEVFRMAITL